MHHLCVNLSKRDAVPQREAGSKSFPKRIKAQKVPKHGSSKKHPRPDKRCDMKILEEEASPVAHDSFLELSRIDSQFDASRTTETSFVETVSQI